MARRLSCILSWLFWGVSLERQASAAVDKAMAALTGRLLPGEALSWKKPTRRPHTQAVVAAFAEADAAGVPDDVRQLLIGAYWTRGTNIGDPEVLRRLIAGSIMRGHSTSDPLRRFGYAVSPSRGPITTGAYQRIRHWRAQWKQLKAPHDVVLVEAQGTSTGLDALDRLATLIETHDAPVNPYLPDPGRYPTVRVDPPQGWQPAAHDPHMRPDSTAVTPTQNRPTWMLLSEAVDRADGERGGGKPEGGRLPDDVLESLPLDRQETPALPERLTDPRVNPPLRSATAPPSSADTSAARSRNRTVANAM